MQRSLRCNQTRSLATWPATWRSRPKSRTLRTDFFEQLGVERVPVPTHYIRHQFTDDENKNYLPTDIEDDIWVPVATTSPEEYAEALQVVLENYSDTESSGRFRVWIETLIRS